MFMINFPLSFSHLVSAGQLEKIFVCFPDPHFKAKNHRRRIVSANMLGEYALVLYPGGRLYMITGTCTGYERRLKLEVDLCALFLSRTSVVRI